jgi:chromosome segregation ATPase
MTSSLQAETSSILLLVKDLEESKEKEFNALKAITEGLQSALSSEKMTSAQSAADAFDARIELKILDNKYSLMLQSKDEALLKSENARTIMARNMLQANAVLASLRVQLNEKDHEIEDAMHDLRQTKEVAGKKLEDIIELKRLVLELAAVQQSESELKEEIITQATEIDVLLDFNSTLKTDLEDKERNLDELTEELKDKEGSSCRLREDLQRVERDCQRHVTGLQRQVLSSRAAYVAKHIQNEKHIACFHQKENVAKEKIDNLHEANASLKGEMEKMNVTLNENKHQIEQLQKATGVLEIDILNEEGKNKEPESRKKTESKEKTQLLRNIECLSSK